MDGLCETTLTILNEMCHYPVVIGQELDRYLPFLATTEILNMATKAGLGREEAHEAIKRYSVEAALAMREGENPQLANRLGSDPLFQRVGITEDSIGEILRDREHFIGNAREQIENVNTKGLYFFGKYPKEAAYQPLLD